MSDAVPFWRRMRTNGGGARLTALFTLLAMMALAGLMLALPLHERLEEAQRTAANLDLRADALNRAARERLAEAEIAAPPPAAIAAAEAYLADHAPRAARDAAMLDLLSSVRLIAQASDVTLTTTAPLDARRGEARLFNVMDDAGLSVLAAEARIVADHEGVARFLMAVEQARPVLRATTLEVAARTSRADREADRLTARILIGAIIRVAEAE